MFFRHLPEADGDAIYIDSFAVELCQGKLFSPGRNDKQNIAGPIGSLRRPPLEKAIVRCLPESSIRQIISSWWSLAVACGNDLRELRHAGVRLSEHSRSC